MTLPAMRSWPPKHAANPAWSVSAVLVAGAAVRLVHLFRPPLDFQPTRQFLSGLIARYLWDAGFHGTASGGAKLRAAMIEPPVHEVIAVAGFWLTGSENFWIPRLVSIAAWVAGAWCLYLLGRRLGNHTVGVVAAVFYLFAPFAITASRSFMPDPLMVPGLVLSAYVSLRYSDFQTRQRFAVAAAAGALAVLLKAQAIFFVLGIFGALVFSKELSSRSLRRSIAFAALSLAPAALWLWLTGGGRSTVYFLPSLFSTPSFWDGWLKQINLVVGVGTLAAAVVGAVLFREREARALFWGWIAGYLLLAVFFDYRVATHDYYSMPLLPLAGLGLGMLAVAPFGHLRTLGAALATVNCVGLLVVAVASQVEPLTIHDLVTPRAAVYRDLGRHLAPGSHGIAIADGYGTELPIDYYAAVSAQPWPSAADRVLDSASGRPDPPDDRLLVELRAQNHPDWLVVIDPARLKDAPTLASALRRLRVQSIQANGYWLYCFRSCSR